MDANDTAESLTPEQFSLLMSHVDKLRESLEGRLDGMRAELKRELQNVRDLLSELANQQKNT